jgi:hypothetical protein
MPTRTWKFRSEGADQVVADYERVARARRSTRFATNAAVYTLAAVLGADVLLRIAAIAGLL